MSFITDGSHKLLTYTSLIILERLFSEKANSSNFKLILIDSTLRTFIKILSNQSSEMAFIHVALVGLMNIARFGVKYRAEIIKSGVIPLMF